MTINEFIAEFAFDTGLSQVRAKEVTEVFLEKIVKAMERGEEISFMEFGTFKTTMSTRENYINPRTGERITVDPKLTPKLIFSKKVKNRIKGARV